MLDAWDDGLDADRNAMDVRKSTRSVARATRVELHLAPVGGDPARIRRMGL